ncbi:hypothetical protein GSI_00995 [Ganoderma sinense ZZ0214-1]|uniref:Uncharacterized protein n=1 Tax=Ganoderma sinense ZZ0214-1 TaxID=1077348 RepID=A0A2G8SU94_9APHY|nr:hypothetical protein GSI_00995 [Ganoderma sinense ZZ0214-1]
MASSSMASNTSALGLLFAIKEYVTAFMIVSAPALMESDSVQVRSFRELANFEWSFYAAFAANLTVDMLIAASVLFLFRGFLTGIKRFDVILQVVILCVVGSGLVSAVLTTLSLLLYLLWPKTFLYIACYWILAKRALTSAFS